MTERLSLLCRFNASRIVWGIGSYTEQPFPDATGKGVQPDGKRLYLAMPSPDYAKISDADVRALGAYCVQGVKPGAKQPPETDLNPPVQPALGHMLQERGFC